MNEAADKIIACLPDPTSDPKAGPRRQLPRWILWSAAGLIAVMVLAALFVTFVYNPTLRLTEGAGGFPPWDSLLMKEEWGIRSIVGEEAESLGTAFIYSSIWPSNPVHTEFTWQGVEWDLSSNTATLHQATYTEEFASDPTHVIRIDEVVLEYDDRGEPPTRATMTGFRWEPVAGSWNQRWWTVEAIR